MWPAGPRVLVSGAGVAGPVTAYWLRRFGCRPTVVERTSELRIGDGGQAVDLFGPALDVLAWMGQKDAVWDARTRTEIVSLIRQGHPGIDVEAARLAEGVSDRHVEIMRGDLSKIVYDTCGDDVEYIFGDSIRTLHDTGAEVEVSFHHAGPRTFDLVVGADGLHSTTRRLTFGDEHQFLHFLGGYLAVFTVDNYLGLAGRMLAYSDVNRTVALYPVQRQHKVRVLFLLRTSELLVQDRDDVATQRRLLQGLFQDMGWEIPRLLAALEHAEDLYVDSISQIRMDGWSRGRVALVGDAGYSPGPAVGGGTSLAVVGAYVLAAELAAAACDHRHGFRAYQESMADAVRQSQRIGPAVLSTLIPRSRAQVWATAQAVRLLPRLPSPVRRRLTAYGGGPAAMLNGVVLRDPEELSGRGARLNAMTGETSTDPEEVTRRLAERSHADGSPTAWFEELYAAAARGRATVPWDRGQPHPLLVEWTEQGAVRGDGRTALVVGTGLGYDAELLSQLGFKTTAFDVSPTAVQAVRDRFPNSSVSYLTADLLALPPGWKSAFDLVVEIFTIQSLPRRVRDDATAAVRGTVASGGTLLVIASVSDDDDPAGPPWPLTQSEVEAFATDGLTPILVEELPEPHRWRAEFRRS
jgi:2-polyprenyl-6-methoxyphenol hydroxylase-like FAD-dependent oxidoreductase